MEVPLLLFVYCVQRKRSILAINAAAEKQENAPCRDWIIGRHLQRGVQP